MEYDEHIALYLQNLEYDGYFINDFDSNPIDTTGADTTGADTTGEDNPGADNTGADNPGENINSFLFNFINSQIENEINTNEHSSNSTSHYVASNFDTRSVSIDTIGPDTIGPDTIGPDTFGPHTINLDSIGLLFNSILQPEPEPEPESGPEPGQARNVLVSYYYVNSIESINPSNSLLATMLLLFNNSTPVINLEDHEIHMEDELFANNLILNTYSNILKQNTNICEGCCPICYEEFEMDDSCGLTKCNHLFHMDCIKEWLTNKCRIPICPICRNDLRE